MTELEEYLNERERTIYWLGRKIGMSNTQIYGRLKRGRVTEEELTDIKAVLPLIDNKFFTIVKVSAPRKHATEIESIKEAISLLSEKLLNEEEIEAINLLLYPKKEKEVIQEEVLEEPTPDNNIIPPEEEVVQEEEIIIPPNDETIYPYDEDIEDENNTFLSSCYNWQQEDIDALRASPYRNGISFSNLHDGTIIPSNEVERELKELINRGMKNRGDYSDG